ncbi:expressed protein [Arabidopsis lyrata subsp. lyrata]|uniref:Expressed protein n=1 Tax=Arabidopsis lyrata subsp. lyrata TaxID=81972 RepID=D7M3B9_ARALL|nr:expressed protein [Arabidopsis lyrata subsp. lyrata]
MSLEKKNNVNGAIFSRLLLFSRNFTFSQSIANSSPPPSLVTPTLKNLVLNVMLQN